MVHLQIAPNIEFKLDLDLKDIDQDSRDYDVQQHKAEVYAEFEKRLKQAFPEGFHIDSFEFGLDNKKH